MRYQYRTVEVDPSNCEKMESLLTEHAAAGWRLHSIVPTYLHRWPHNPDHSGPEDIYVSVARAVFERERDDG